MIRTDHDSSVAGRIPARQEGGDGGFAAAALSDDAHEAVFGNLHVDPVKDLPASVIGEAHALEKEISAILRKLSRFLLRLFELQKFKDPVAGSHAVHGHMEIASQLSHGQKEIC